MFTSNVFNYKCFRQTKRARLWKNAILWAISQREISLLVVIFKKNRSALMEDYSTQLQTYTSNRVHIIQILSAAPSFMGVWATRSPLKIHCYTCMSFKTCWSRLIYTKLSSHRSFVINMYVITMAWRCISPWSFHRSLQRRQEIDIFHICQISAFWRQNYQKKNEENLDWTLVNTENLRV